MNELASEHDRPLRIALDARLNAYRVGGIPQYTAQLATALADIAPEDRIVLLEHRKSAHPVATGDNIRRRHFWTPPHNRWEQWILPLELLTVRADVLHCPDFIPPLRRRIPAVITVHDLAFMHFPEILDDQARRYYGQIGLAVTSADAIIAVSEATARDLQELLGVPAERITIVPEAAASIYKVLELDPDANSEVNGVSLVAGTFALFVGTVEPRKNLPTLLQALSLCRSETPEATPQLVVAGPRGWLDGPIFELIRDLRLGDQVQFVGGVSPEQLVWMYNACRFYVQPELYSGFGLPVLEAMQCGAAVAAADAAALPELVADAGLLIPAMDIEGWAEALRRLWTDENLRADLRSRGLERAANYTWERAARETRAVYQKVLK